MEASQRRELTEDMRRGSGSFELVVSPMFLALLGLGLDRWLGLTPMLTILFAAVGFAGASASLYYRYKTDMDQHEAGAPWAKQS